MGRVLAPIDDSRNDGTLLMSHGGARGGLSGGTRERIADDPLNAGGRVSERGYKPRIDTATILILVLSAATPALGFAATASDPPAGGFLGLFRSWSDLALGGVLGTAIGYLIKWALEQLSLRVAARREFAQKVTDQISSLADNYYWGLANYAGVLAGALEGYLQLRYYHLLLHWERKLLLRGRLNELADEATARSFPYLCRLISLFYMFQFEGSNTYLLTDHAAGETCKRLYNTFVGSLPQDKLNLANLYALEIDYQKSEKRKVSEIPPAHLTKEVIDRNEELKETYKAWRNWLRNDLSGVLQAADALRAYNELLLHELAKLYRDWFGRKQPDVPYVEEVVLDAWPNVLSEQSFVAIGRARQQPALLVPLGSAVSGKPSPESEDQKRAGGGADEEQAGVQSAKEKTKDVISQETGSPDQDEGSDPKSPGSPKE